MTYRILSLDGGGSWALIEVKALMEVFSPNMPGREVMARFDLVAANSGGSIVLGCLVENMTLREILGFFEDQNQREAVFSPTNRIKYRLLGWTGAVPKYSASKKLPALERVMPKTGKICLNGITADILGNRSGKPVHLLITSFDYDRNRATFFRSDAASRKDWGTGAAAKVTLAEAIHASSNAPVKYFDGPAAFPANVNRYGDGAITGCNNPVLAAVTEAVGMGVPADQIVALSLGTGTVARPWPRSDEPSSPFFLPAPKVSWHGDLGKLAGSILDDPPDVASFLAHVMTGCGEGVRVTLPDGRRIDSRIVRMNPLISPIRKMDTWSPPGDLTIDQFNFLANLSLDAIQQRQVEAISHYADIWLASQSPNQPVRLDGDTLTCELGQASFSDALAAWLAHSTGLSDVGPTDWTVRDL